MKTVKQQTIDTMRVLAAEAIDKAKSGHPGIALGAMPMAYTLWAEKMKHSPKNIKWQNRDRFVLSSGHGSAMLYALLHMFDYGLTLEDLKNFRQEGSKTPGHPEYGEVAGVEITTGPLGQGIANGVGFAMAERHLASKFNRDGIDIIDHYTYVLCGDGCLMEGIASEAASLAGTLGLGKLIVLYDSNSITIEGSTDLAFTEDVCARFEAYGWQTLSVSDGNDTDLIAAAIDEAKAEKDKPTIIKITTEIGFGAPNAGTSQVHGEALGAEKLAKLKENLGVPADEFYVPDEVRAHMSEVVSDLNKNEDEWNKKYADYAAKYPELAKEWEALISGKLDMDKLDSDEFWSFENKANATRNLSGETINRLAKIMPNLFGGSADLAPSNKTNIKDGGDFSKDNYAGRNIHFGVREHAMGAIANAMAAYGGIHPFVATFFVFSDYVKPAMRLSALMELPVTYVFSHDSIGVGEDGPTHQPIEQLAAMRSIPGFVDFRPADGHETAAAWYYSVTNGKHPVGIALTRQNLPYYEETGKGALKGAYVVRDSKDAKVILIASGSELELAYKAYDELAAEGIAARVVSMPSVALFEMQSEEYRESVLPKSIRARVFVEAGCGFGLDRYVGLDGAKICMEGFGASAPYSKLFPKFGFTVENVVNTAKKLVK